MKRPELTPHYVIDGLTQSSAARREAVTVLASSKNRDGSLVCWSIMLWRELRRHLQVSICPPMEHGCIDLLLRRHVGIHHAPSILLQVFQFSLVRAPVTNRRMHWSTLMWAWGSSPAMSRNRSRSRVRAYVCRTIWWKPRYCSRISYSR